MGELDRGQIYFPRRVEFLWEGETVARRCIFPPPKACSAWMPEGGYWRAEIVDGAGTSEEVRFAATSHCEALARGGASSKWFAAKLDAVEASGVDLDPEVREQIRAESEMVWLP